MLKRIPIRLRGTVAGLLFFLNLQNATQQAYADGSNASGGAAFSDVGKAINDKAGKLSDTGTGSVIKLSPGLQRLPVPILLRGLIGTANQWITVEGASDGTTIIVGSRSYALKSVTNSDQSPGGFSGDTSKLKIVEIDPKLLSDLKAAVGTRQVPIEVLLSVFEGNEKLHLARWPEAGYAHANAILDASPKNAVFDIGDVKAGAWQNEQHLIASGFFGQDWFYDIARVKQIDPAEHSIHLDDLSANYPLGRGFRYFISNAASELRNPGEFYVDLANRHIWVWPLNEADQSVEISDLQTLAKVERSKYIRFKNLSFARSMGDGVSVLNSENIEFINCRFSETIGKAINVNGGSNVVIANSVISDTAGAAVSLTGGDRRTLKPAGNTVRDSIIYNFGQLWRSYTPGVSIGGVGQIVRHNRIYNGPHAAIIFNGNDHTIQSNEIYDVINQSSDAGAIYSGRDWSSRGTQIIDNYLHDIVPSKDLGIGGRRFEVKGVYLDDMLSGTTVTGNIFSNVMQPVFVGGGRNNLIESNLFVDIPGWSIIVDARGFSPGFQTMINDRSSPLRKTYDQAAAMSPLYGARYPGFTDMLNLQPGAPIGNQFKANVAVRSQLFSFRYDADKYSPPGQNKVVEPSAAGEIGHGDNLLKSLESKDTEIILGRNWKFDQLDPIKVPASVQ